MSDASEQVTVRALTHFYYCETQFMDGDRLRVPAEAARGMQRSQLVELIHADRGGDPRQGRPPGPTEREIPSSATE